MTQHKYVVAVVDDDPRLLESLEELLESASYAVRSFSSAAALIRAGLAGLDLLITDVGMPGLDGFALRDLVNRERPELPVFLITGRHEIAEQIRARAVESFFCKPFDGQALLAAIARALTQQGRGR
ncbi:response regulator [Chelatococcus asaccharovorans]|uniref:Response regulator receiver domain-containing protein n=1 Tax=Chelatococcus asaccharovorans TaxID=28210 RepID=A0A2V3TSP4_9HYPH|nr:response regulator [Chelatococcus asaccharovorans]MBS7704987.1 response regulator [Chelatococcus asaccharovorans]PXW51902.1 response regulator receiver domain-containing protein [Chelatococcus asaccharovorans]